MSDTDVSDNNAMKLSPMTPGGEATTFTVEAEIHAPPTPLGLDDPRLIFYRILSYQEKQARRRRESGNSRDEDKIYEMGSSSSDEAVSANKDLTPVEWDKILTNATKILQENRKCEGHEQEEQRQEEWEEMQEQTQENRVQMQEQTQESQVQGEQMQHVEGTYKPMTPCQMAMLGGLIFLTVGGFLFFLLNRNTNESTETKTVDLKTYLGDNFHDRQSYRDNKKE